MFNVLSNQILTARNYAEAYSGRYFAPCDTYEEVKKCLASCGIYISKGIRLKDFGPAEDLKCAKDGMCYVLVQFSTEENYTEYEYLWMSVQKKYRKRFERYLREELDETA